MSIRSSYSSPDSATANSNIINLANVDNSGRLEISSNIALGEYNHYLNNLPLFFDKQEINNGTATYDAATNSVILDVTAVTGDGAIHQTKQWHPYFPGHAQQAEFTFIGFTPETNVTKRIGYYSSATTGEFDTTLDGFYLQSDPTNNVTFNITKEGTRTFIAQSNWNDPLDGTGASGITIDWDNFQVFMIDFLYLGGTYVNLYYIAEGRRHLIHSYNHANAFPDVIVGSPSQPIRAEIRGTGGTGRFNFVCAQVSTLGANIELAGKPFGFDIGTTQINVASAGTEYALLGIRKNVRSREAFINNISVVTSAGATETYRWRLLINPSFSAGSLSYSAIANTDLDRAVGNGTQTITPNTGYVIASGVGASRNSIVLDISKILRIGTSIAGTYDTLVLGYTPYQNTQNTAASMNGFII